MLTQTAIDYFGSIAKLAEALNIKAPSVYSWGDEVPRGRQFELQHLTKGKLKVQEAPKRKKKPQ